MLTICLAILRWPKKKQTLEEIYRRESEELLRYAEGKLKDRTLAEDMVADSFERLVKSFHRYAHLEETELRRLLVTILQNRIVDWYRKEGKERSCQELSFSLHQDSGDSALNARAWELYQKNGGIEEYGIRRDILLQLLEYIGELPEQSRRIFLLRYQEGWKPQKIAQELRLPIRTVNQQLYRTKSKLKEKMEKDGYEKGDCNF